MRSARSRASTGRRAGPLAGAIVAGAALLVVWCGAGAGEPRAVAQSPADVAPDSLARLLLTRLRGADPVVCELAVRAVDGRNGWSSTPMDLATVGALPPREREAVRWAVSGSDERRDAATPTLVEGLGDSDLCVRRVAALELGRAGGPRALSALRSALTTGDPRRRAIGALGLGYAEDAGSLDGLVEALGDSDSEVRATAAWALGQIEDTRAIPALVSALRGDDSADVRRAAAWALGEIE